ncbi:hemolysin D [Oceanobacillus picturae]|uniref:Hemolysin D n=1 Tax=Oceanobacillus picturae TaxID=171693 RepID=A0A0U9HFD6_9BACI|nr:efflux RND transporter periplasmic adaptor subunit [Oceanobacillus picturae]GAQ19921.1 hemolysin D [Oceanobacillus picturae]
MIKKWIAGGVIFIIIGFVIYGWGIGKSQLATTASNEVETITLQEKEMSETVIVPGNLMIFDEQVITYQSDKGEVEEILVKKGDKVKKGDDLIHYKNERLLNEKKQNQIQLELGYLEVNNIQKKHKSIDEKLGKDEDNEVLQSEHDDIKLQEQIKGLEINQLQIKKESIEQELANTTVKSSINGTVISISEGAFVSSEYPEQQPLLHIGSMENMIFKGKISEYDMLKIKKEQIAKITSDAIPNEYWEGEIFFISDLPEQYDSEDDYSGAYYTVEAKLDIEEIPLKPGFKMLMEVETDRKLAFTLPLTVVKREAETDYVYVVEEGVAIRKEVETGIATHEVIEITDGLIKNEEVILKPEEVTEGMEVTLQ